MAFHTILFLFVAGALGGALNAVAGGGSFIVFPALLFSGVAPIAANATNTVALWVGTTASSRAYRKHLDISRRVMIPLTVTSLIGGIAVAVASFVLWVAITHELGADTTAVLVVGLCVAIGIGTWIRVADL